MEDELLNDSEKFTKTEGSMTLRTEGLVKDFPEAGMVALQIWDGRGGRTMTQSGSLSFIEEVCGRGLVETVISHNACRGIAYYLCGCLGCCIVGVFPEIVAALHACSHGEMRLFSWGIVLAIV